MPETSSFRHVDEKHLLSEVDLMQWSPKMDLIAVATLVGEVILYRLSWQKVWTLAQLNEAVKVTALAWRPDGKVLAIGYNSGRIHLCDVEDSTCLHKLNFSFSVTFLGWITETNTKLNVNKQEAAVGIQEEEEFMDCFKDISAEFLPRLPPFSKSNAAGGSLPKAQEEDLVEDSKKLKEQTDLNILIVGMENGVLELSAYGVFPLGRLDLTSFRLQKGGKVLSGHLAENLGMLSVVVEQNVNPCEGIHVESTELYILTFDTTLLKTACKELRTLALKLGHVLTLESYLESTISQMSEAWEDILLEMDSKLMKYAEEKYKVCNGSVSNDFLRLLMLGNPSDELKNFLQFDLTEKGLKKLGHSIETSYSNIQKLLLKHLQSVTQAMVFHLTDVEGMSRWPDCFSPLGLSTSLTQQAVKMAGSFMLKSSELQQVIDGSMKNFKAFFRWLYVVMQRMSNEPVPASLSKMSQQDLSFVAQFLHDNFTQDVQPHKSGFKLEKVGQYLKNDVLSNPIDSSTNPWIKFLHGSSNMEAKSSISLMLNCRVKKQYHFRWKFVLIQQVYFVSNVVEQSQLLYNTYQKKSLVQVFHMLQACIDSILQECAKTIQQSINCGSTVHLMYGPNVYDTLTSHVTQCSTNVGDQSYIYTAFASKKPTSSKFFIHRQTVPLSNRDAEVVGLKCGQIACHDYSDRPSLKEHDILDLSFYDGKTLSLLLQENCENGQPVLVQLSINAIENMFVLKFTNEQHFNVRLEDIPCCDVGQMIEPDGFRVLENMKASKFAVSGTRKVACVLFASRRRVRLFLTDVEDEDETILTMDNSREKEKKTEDFSSIDLMNSVSEEENKENSASS